MSGFELSRVARGHELTSTQVRRAWTAQPRLGVRSSRGSDGGHASRCGQGEGQG